jgi:hypothetical protein
MFYFMLFVLISRVSLIIWMASFAPSESSNCGRCWQVLVVQLYIKNTHTKTPKWSMRLLFRGDRNLRFDCKSLRKWKTNVKGPVYYLTALTVPKSECKLFVVDFSTPLCYYGFSVCLFSLWKSNKHMKWLVVCFLIR